VYLHEGVIHGYNEYLASIFELRVGDVARDMGVGTCRAWSCVRRGSGMFEPLDWNLSNEGKGAKTASADSHHRWDWVKLQHRQGVAGHLLNAAGTPMMRPEPSSLERLTLLPGLLSYRSMLGIESPALTMTAADEWN
jgi:hypothetical protein